MIRLFTNFFRCISEAVEIRNGATEYSPLIGRFCKTQPSSQFSTDNMMYIKFLTDVDDPRNGFKATVSLGKGEKKRIICLFCHTIREFSIL